MIIKVLLVLGVLAFGALIMRQRPSGSQQALVRLGGIGVAAAGVVAVIFPDLTVWAAHLVGVKRGTDLMLYGFVMTFLFSTLAAYQRFHHLEQRVIELTRQLALAEIRRQDAREDVMAELVPEPPGG